MQQKFILLIEEVGEFAKSVRKTAGIKVNTHSDKYDSGAEASDVLYMLLDICNKLDMDLGSEFDKKIKKVASYK